MIGLLLFAVLFLQVDHPSASVELLLPGLLHGDEVQSEADGEWWGLYTTEDSAELKRVTVSIKRVNDPIVDDDDEMTGKEISVNTEETPNMLLKGLSGAKEGRLGAVLLNKRLPYPGETMSFGTPIDDEGRMKLEGYLMAYGRAEPSPSGPLIKEYRLVFQRNADQSPGQTIFESKLLDQDAYPRIIWAGDIDGDNELDFLMDLATHYNLTVPTLFLSTKAKAGEFVGLAGQVSFSGC